MFGNNTTSSGGFFGSSNTANSTGGIFGGGGNQPQNTGSIFGANNQAQTQNTVGIFGQQGGTGGGMFGGGTANQAGGSIFGGSSNISTNSNSMFGGANNQNKAGIFGNNPSNQNTGNSLFQGQQNTLNTQNTGNMFGGNTPQNTGGTIFGSPNTQQNVNGVGFFGSSSNTNTTSNTGTIFGGGNTSGISMFGGNQNTNTAVPSFGSPSNTTTSQGLGWGVNTGNQQQNIIGGTNNIKFQPVKSRNPKIDAKHLVKCITALEQNYNFCKNELRIRFMLTGQTSGGQPSQGFGMGQTQGNSAFGFSSKSGLSFGATTSSNLVGSSFGNPATTANSSIFGGTPTPVGGTAPNPFGGNTNTNTNSIFGGNSNIANTNSMFGGNTGNTGNMNMGNTGMFGGGSSTATSGIFGGNTSTNQGGIFGNNFSANNTSSPFGGGNAGSLFGGNTGNTGNTNSTAGGSIFGGNTANNGSLFGGNTNTNANAGNNQSGIFSFNNTANSGNPNSPFGTANSGNSLWGNNVKPNNNGGLFTPTNTTTTGGIFNSSVPSTPNVNTGSLFGAATGLFNAATNNNSNIFGNNAANTNTGTQGNTGIFGANNNTTNTGSLFGGNNNNAGNAFGGNNQPNPLMGTANAMNNNAGMSGLNTGLFGSQANAVMPGNTNLFGGNMNSMSSTSNNMSLTDMITAAHFVNQHPQYFEQLKQSNPTLAYQLASLLISQQQVSKSSYNVSDRLLPRTQSELFSRQNTLIDGFENLSLKNPVTSILGSSNYDMDSSTINRRFGNSLRGPVISLQTDQKNRRQAFDYDNLRFGWDPLMYTDSQKRQNRNYWNESELLGRQRTSSSLSATSRMNRNMDLLHKEHTLQMERQRRDRQIAHYYQNMYNDMATSLFSEGDQDANKRAAFFKKYKTKTPYDELMQKTQDQQYLSQIRKQREENQRYTQEMQRSNIEKKNSSVRSKIADDFILPRVPTENDYDAFGKIKKETFNIPKPKVIYRPELRSFKNNKPILNEIDLQDGQEDIKKRVSYDDLPILAQGYSIKPSLDQLRQITVYQLKKAKNVEISNSYGRIKFISPINLYKKDIKKCITIGQDIIDIKDVEWENKQAFMTFHNFGNYTKLEGKEKQKIQKKMKKWINKMNMKLVTFAQDAGDLTVKI